MCGIIAYKGNQDAACVVLEGLKKLEYRGYDSWGITTKTKHKLETCKRVGRIGNVLPEHLNMSKTSIAIGHSRWATHGNVTMENAHPHFCCDNKIAVVHNGIIENFQDIRIKLELLGHTFLSNTDTEVIPHLIEYYLSFHPYEEAVKKALADLDGTYAIVILNKDDDKVIAARKGSPLVIGKKGNEYFIASDVPAFLQHTKQVLFIEDNEMVIINKEIRILNYKLNKEIKKDLQEITWTIDQAEKGNFNHFMLKEIFDQPSSIIATLQQRITNAGIDIRELKGIENFSNIIITACGTACYAGLVGEYMIEALAKIPVCVEYASEFRYRDPIVDKNTLLIAVTQSGETADTLAAVQEAKRKKATVLSIVNVMESTIARESDKIIYTRAGPEIGVASTKAFTSQLTVLYLIALYIAKMKNRLTDKDVIDHIQELKKIPVSISKLLSKNKIKEIAVKYYDHTNFLYLGRGPNYPIALEGALKLKEISYIHAEGQSAAEMKHGPIALIDNDMPSVFIAPLDKTYKKIIGNIQEVKARGGKVIAIATQGDKDINNLADDVIYIQKTSELLLPILAVVPLQLLAYHIADLRGCDIDKPKNLAKSVTVE